MRECPNRQGGGDRLKLKTQNCFGLRSLSCELWKKEEGRWKMNSLVLDLTDVTDRKNEKAIFLSCFSNGRTSYFSSAFAISSQYKNVGC
ncbi:hypothetical protein IQ269_17990 [Tychonema sp. LEGE 07199]|uniref:hypothetical protein n=1 Tax=unclassified Tychonema TaxID=2642144 RepID=UPI0018807753|nr:MULTISPECIES: hypothetical protein [unclassified Tychonema]MBE9122638.1 hypothetical protein [Tychonema sp. LEGE 07199]MBE9131525.1 hypothetical protein [Tychonema sp. LEGE 07196]